MLPIDPAELSAYVDGELTSQRAEEIRAALARDPVLRATYEQLAVLDADWSARAASVMFRPRVRVGPAPFAGPFLLVAAMVLGLLLVRMGLKFLPPILGTSLEAMLLVLVVLGGLGRILRFTDEDRDRVLRMSNC
ncbi:hypothetical protein BH10PLA2_BH10PLA2_03130 [soil metagenome]